MPYQDYTWTRYYEDICRRQKKLNNTLAVELGEITAKTEELSIALNRIVGSPLWKMLGPVRKLARLAGHRGGADMPAGPAKAPAANASEEPQSPEERIYADRLWAFEDHYSNWISTDPVEIRYASYVSSGQSRVRKAHYRIVYIEDCGGMRPPFDMSVRAPWLLFVSRNGILANDYAERLDEYLENAAEAVIAYADEDHYYTTSEGIHRAEPDFKPDWSPDTLDSFFYFGHCALIRSGTAIRADWLGSHDPLANVYDLFLQVADRCGKHYDDPGVIHIPQILFHNNVDRYIYPDPQNNRFYNDSYDLWVKLTSELKDDLAAGKLCFGASTEYDALKRRTFKRRGIRASMVDGQFPGDRHIMYELPAGHRVSVLILTKDHPDVLKDLLDSFLERTDYDDLEFIVVDNGSTPENREEYKAYIEDVLRDIPHEYIYEPRAFNFSALCNRAARAAGGDFLLFMNDDIEIIQKDWLRLMTGYAALSHVGAVGAKLLYADSDLIQHAGITSMQIGPSHKLVIYPDDRSYYYGKNTLAHDMIGVTGACLLIKTEKYDLIGGFDESFPVAYNDVDFCMRLAESGYVNLQCNSAVLYHHESLTRGQDEGNEDKWRRLLEEKKRLYEIHPGFSDFDPYYNQNLVGNHSNYQSNFDYGYNNHTKCESVRRIDASELAENAGEKYKISIDFAGVQSKIRLEEPEIIEVRGWSFMPGGDNSLHHVNIILQNEADGTLLRGDCYPMPREDLESTFPAVKNNRLCGFEFRMLKHELAPGSYRIGVEPVVLNHDLNSTVSQGIVIYTDSEITVQA